MYLFDKMFDANMRRTATASKLIQFSIKAETSLIFPFLFFHRDQGVK